MDYCHTCNDWVHNFISGKYGPEYGVCSIATEDSSNGLVDVICFSEGIAGELITRKDFGCILHKDFSCILQRERET